MWSSLGVFVYDKFKCDPMYVYQAANCVFVIRVVPETQHVYVSCVNFYTVHRGMVDAFLLA